MNILTDEEALKVASLSFVKSCLSDYNLLRKPQYHLSLREPSSNSEYYWIEGTFAPDGADFTYSQGFTIHEFAAYYLMGNRQQFIYDYLEQMRKACALYAPEEKLLRQKIYEKTFWFIHNVFAHPIMEVCNILGAKRIANQIHDLTLPPGTKTK